MRLRRPERLPPHGGRRPPEQPTQDLRRHGRSRLRRRGRAGRPRQVPRHRGEHDVHRSHRIDHEDRARGCAARADRAVVGRTPRRHPGRGPGRRRSQQGPLRRPAPGRGRHHPRQQRARAGGRDGGRPRLLAARKGRSGRAREPGSLRGRAQPRSRRRARGEVRQPCDRQRPYAFVPYRGGYAVVDAAANDLLWAHADGSVSVLAVFPTRKEPLSKTAAARMGAPPGMTSITTQAVPSSVTVGPDGALYVGELTGVPFTPGSARVWRIVPGQEDVDLRLGLHEHLGSRLQREEPARARADDEGALRGLAHPVR